MTNVQLYMILDMSLLKGGARFESRVLLIEVTNLGCFKVHNTLVQKIRIKNKKANISTKNTEEYLLPTEKISITKNNTFVFLPESEGRTNSGKGRSHSSKLRNKNRQNPNNIDPI